MSQLQATLDQFPEHKRIELIDKFVNDLLKTPQEEWHEPKVATSSRGRPSLTSRRNPSKFEIVEREVKKRDKIFKRKAKEMAKKGKKKQRVSVIFDAVLCIDVFYIDFFY